MSDDTEPTTADEIAILQALRGLEATDLRDFASLLRQGEFQPAAVRPYTEVLGLLPYAEASTRPRPEVKERLLASLAGDQTQRVTGLGRPQAPAGASSAARPTPSGAPTAPSRWARPLAASLVVGLLGLGALAGALYRQVGEQSAQLAAQEGRLENLGARLQAVQEQNRQLVLTTSADLDQVRERVRLITDQGTEICALKPPAGEPPAPDARGLLFVAGDHQHWFLRLDGLSPASPGLSYQLWFAVDGGQRPVSAGTFEVAPGRDIELGSDRMPEGTAAAFVTLEPVGGNARPSGPVVVYGDQVMQLL